MELVAGERMRKELQERLNIVEDRIDNNEEEEEIIDVELSRGVLPDSSYQVTLGG